jgi:hypothetical protein
MEACYVLAINHKGTDMQNMQFISREDYLIRRNKWKLDYINLSSNIKTLKGLRADAARGGYSAACRLQSACAKMGSDATVKLVELHDLKDVARFSVKQQRDAEHNRSY